MNAAVIEKMAGFLYGKIALSYLKTSTHTVGLMTMRRTARKAPVKIEATAPAVVKRFQTIDRRSAGKLALQATAKARPTMKATFWVLKRKPKSTAQMPKTTVEIFATLTCSPSVAVPCLTTFR